MTEIDTDYLVIGAGATGMAFVDSLIASSDADVVIVDRQHRPGGHWNRAYPFVRLHQPSSFYGVNSRVLGSDSIDEVGCNAGLYERATADEICSYFGQVLDQHLLPSGQVRFFGMSDYLADYSGGHRFVSRLTGETTAVQVRRKVIDATYLETAVPSTHTPSFHRDRDALLIPVNGLVSLAGPGTGFTVIGGGKTAMDACIWLLENGVSPDAIRWIRPRESWLLDRKFQQPLDLVNWLIEGVSLNLEAAAHATDVEDLFRRLEDCGQLTRIDLGIEPTMFRCATVSEGELAFLRSIENVVRCGRVRNIGADRIVLDDASIPTNRGQIHVDCSAAGLRIVPARQIFESDRITLQTVRTCQPTLNAALVAFVEVSDRDDVHKNRLCPPNPYPDRAVDWISTTKISQRAQDAWLREPDLATWLRHSRLDAARGLGDHMTEPSVQSALNRYLSNAEPACANLERLSTQTA